MSWCKSPPLQSTLRLFALFAISVLVAAAMEPAIAQPANKPRVSFSTAEPVYISPATASALTALAQTRAIAQQRASGLDVAELLAAAEAANDTLDADNDTLYDSVEWVLGTDPNNTDSDFDQLNDSYEAKNGLDPLNPDSNDDGLADYLEVMTVPPLFSTSWEEEDIPCAPTVASTDDVTGSWNVTATAHVHLGQYAFEFAGTYNGDQNGNGAQNIYLKIFDVDIPLGKDARLSYWIYHDNSSARQISIDGVTTDGTTISEVTKDGKYITDQYGVRAHPAHREDPNAVWYYVEYDLSLLANETLDYLLVAFNLTTPEAGNFSAYLDDLCLWSNDVDGDGFPNAWDGDNDGDGVPDALDLSPFSKSTPHESFQFEITTNGNPTYINFQLRPKNPDHLRQTLQTWDWPPDWEGAMKDLNNSRDDVHITPMLELTVPLECTIIANHSGKCLEVSNASLDDGANVQQANCSTCSNQFWELESVGNGYYKLIANHSGKCLTVANASLDDGANVQQATCSDSENQLWKLETVGNGTYKLTARHSGKCLEVVDNSTADGANVQQNEYWERDNQLWKLEPVNDIVPNQSAVEDYGISLTLNKIYIPLSNTREFGATVALSGKMFFPASEPLNLSADAQLIWMVTGTSDIAGEKIALKAPNGKYVRAEGGGGKELVANRGSIGDWETFEIVFVAENKVALKVHNGQYIGVDHKEVSVWGGGHWEWYPLVANRAAIGPSETFTLERTNGKVALKANNGKYVCAGCARSGLFFLPPELLTADSTNPVYFDQIQVAEAETETTILARYPEEFMLTGFSVEENYGSEVGVFYSSEIDRTIETGLVLAYAFLRNATTQLSEMPAILPEYNVTEMNATFASFSHQDEALLALTSNMTPNILAELPEGAVLPTIAAFEDKFTSVLMDELVSDSYILGTNLTVDLRPLPVVTTKGFKMGWYNTSTNETVKLEAILAELEDWVAAKGLDENASATLVNLVLAWHTGESRITRIGSVDCAFNVLENDFVLNEIKINGIGNIADTLQTVKASEAYEVLKVIRTVIKTIRGTLNAVKWVINTFKVFNTLKQGFVGFSAKASAWLLFIDALITQGMMLYAFFSIAIEGGWSGISVVVAIATYFFIGWWTALNMILGPIGIVLTILDLIFGFSSDLLEAIIDWITDVEADTEPDLELLESTTIIDDYDNNGLDAGDRIELRSRLIGTVKLYEAKMNLLNNSYINPYYVYTVPAGTENKSIYNASNWTYRNRVCSTPFPGMPEYCWFQEKVREFKTGMWVKPSSMINFPLTFRLTADYMFYYDECYWILFIEHCNWDLTKYGSTSTNPTTLYFDVLPASVSQFVSWKSITSLDYDGDELLNSEERTNGTNPWRFDTDSDGLSDTYELEYGTNPTKSDTDGDGLNDYLELQLGTDPFMKDTDGDSLSDSEEHNGWQVDFTYYGHEFTEQVWSNPLMNDTDDDGLTDLVEFMKRLNPRSMDTDGNGTRDADEFIIPRYGCIKEVDFDGKGSSIRVPPNATINATVEYQLMGLRDPVSGEPANCSIEVTMDNSSLNETMYTGTPELGNITEGSATFSFNASLVEGISTVRAFWNWSMLNETLPAEEREVIGIIITSTNVSAEWVTDGPDSDGDRILDPNEAIGWDVTFIDANGTQTIHVTSDPRLADSDADGVTDLDEWNGFTNSSNPRAEDTDGDGLTDLVELEGGYNLLSYDTDGDGLDDSTELTFSSDPKDADTDDDGLTDAEEFAFSSDPNNPDTDGDGLSDWHESVCGSSLLQPDPDDDTLFDNLECALGTDPWNPDTDEDGLRDGYEVHVLTTSPALNDTDFDLLLDGDELTWKTDPLCNDTDQDGLWDGIELELGTNPLYKDTDYDGIIDSEDPDSYAAHVEEVILARDPDADLDEFVDNLLRYTNVTTVTADELLANYTSEPYIVLVGRPDGGNGTVGNITRHVLAADNETLTKMLESEYDRFAIKYGVWNSTQTVVMLAQPYPSDHWRVLMMLKSLRETVLPGSVEVAWPTPRDLLRVDSENVLKQTDALVWIALDEAVIPRIKLSRYTGATTPVALTYASGLVWYDTPVGRYLEINVSENVQNETREIITMALVQLYYTAADLDRTGDGLANDTRDINESTLRLYAYNDYTGRWTKLTNGTSGVFETGVNTTNVELYGTSYEGYVWANVSHLSVFGLVSEGSPRRGGGGVPRDSDGDGYTDIEELLAGTDPSDPEGYPGKLAVTLTPGPEPSPVATPIPLLTPVPTPAPTPTGTPAPVTTPTPKEPGFEALLWLLALALAAFIGYVGVARRRG
jgi:hypothetical protein